jgi:hypothetical protein
MSLFNKNKKPPPEPEWIIVFITNYYPEAHVVAGRLNAEGIQTMIHKEAGASAIGITIGTYGEVKVLVRTEDYESAIDILEPDETDALPDSTDEVSYYWDEEEDDDE